MSRRRPLRPQVLHADSALLVVDKPAGYLTAPGNPELPGVPETLRGAAGVPPDEPFHVVHRLDPDASGVVVYARTVPAAETLRASFAAGRVRQRFLALVAGYLDEGGRIELPIYFDKKRGRVLASPRRGEPAVTEYRVLERVAGNTWIECQVAVGRPEQIRAHLAVIGHPLAFDPAFGSQAALLLSRFKPGYRPNRRGQERPLIARLTLHAAAIELDHPETGARVRFEAALPRDLATTITQLGRLA